MASIHKKLERMRDNGVLRPDVDTSALATGLLAAVEGGYLLSQTAHDPRLMQTSLNAAIDHIMSFAPDSSERASR